MEYRASRRLSAPSGKDNTSSEREKNDARGDGRACMKAIILGSGTAIPLNDRGSPAIVVVIDGKPVLFDLGPGTLRQLTRAGINYEQIEHIFVTHFHPDHTGDLVHLLFASRNPAVLRRRRPFKVAGPPGIARLIADLQAAYPGWLE
ncbi:MAG TPA: MBL fold metallo-hydrolase, partial [Desulfobacteraceae bacterium]|nr:MBL fold metallo-hydrolase [Desulfobacteraceae bacterium]